MTRSRGDMMRAGESEPKQASAEPFEGRPVLRGKVWVMRYSKSLPTTPHLNNDIN